MKKKLLAAAIAATLGHGIAQAANLNPDGLGEVLLYPFYTVEGGHQTLISITNTTNKTKAVKVRFLEAKNSFEVLDFNLYLSPWDMWVGQITEEGTDGAKLVVADNSCTVPNSVANNTTDINGTHFRSFAITDAIGDVPSRVREGHIEIIEMGELNDSVLEAAAKHDGTGVPANCGALENAWLNGSFGNNARITSPTGGLYGVAHLVNVTEGKDYSYDAVAIDGFSNRADHSDPGSIAPSLASASPAISRVFNADSVVTSNWSSGIDAISALFMHKTVMNDFIRDTAVAAKTDWVITFPTKKAYVNSTPAIAPFTKTFGTNGACETVLYTVTDREEQRVTAGLTVSPRPVNDPQALCWESNVIAIGKSDSALNGLNTLTSISGVSFENGWISADLTKSSTGNRPPLRSVNGDNYWGLPTIGFAVEFFKNLNADAGKKAEYGALFQNKTDTPFGGSTGRNPKASAAFGGGSGSSF